MVNPREACSQNSGNSGRLGIRGAFCSSSCDVISPPRTLQLREFVFDLSQLIVCLRIDPSRSAEYYGSQHSAFPVGVSNLAQCIGGALLRDSSVSFRKLSRNLPSDAAFIPIARVVLIEFFLAFLAVGCRL
jgi:hypothetical protein